MLRQIIERHLKDTHCPLNNRRLVKIVANRVTAIAFFLPMPVGWTEHSLSQYSWMQYNMLCFYSILQSVMVRTTYISTRPAVEKTTLFPIESDSAERRSLLWHKMLKIKKRSQGLCIFLALTKIL